jgi:signal transduction histidine kinase
MLSFALGALALSLTVTTITYFSTRSSIVGQYVSSADSTAANNATVVHTDLVENIQPSDIVTDIDEATADSSSLLFAYGAWSLTGRQQIFPGSLPTSLLDLVNSGTPGEQIFTLGDGGPEFVAVGVPVPTLRGTVFYYEVFPMAQASRELRLLLAALVLAAVVTTIAGAVLGRWAARRALRPLRDVSQAALAIAGGRLDTRIETAGESDLGVLASSFNRMVDRLQQRIERDARFTSDVSHELRSPLTTLATSLSVLEGRRDDLPERSRQALDLLGAEIRRFQRMVADLLEISRIDAGSADFQPSDVAVGDLVARALQYAGGGLVPITIDPAVATRRCIVDKRRFERIFTNLIENAQRYAGGATRVVVTGVGDRTVRIVVEDNGPGVALSERERIFERFARGASAAGSRGTGGGTGLGLALVGEHVKLHEGRIWVEDNTPTGARFVLEFPLASDHDEEDEEDDNAAASHPGSPGGEADHESGDPEDDDSLATHPAAREAPRR